MLTALAALGLLGGSGAAEFTATFADYDVGEAVSEKGTAGGRWVLAPGSAASAVVVDEVPACELASATDELTFDLAVRVAETPTRCDAKMRFDSSVVAAASLPVPTDARAALTLGMGCCGGLAFLGLARGRWQELSASAVVAELDRWYDVRVETCSWDGAAYVSYAVKVADGYQRLANSLGAMWFRLDGTTGDFTEVAYQGNGGQIADLAGGAGDEPAQSVDWRWVGGTAGDWNDVANWAEAATGAPAARSPSVGETVHLAGNVALTRGSEAATVHDAVFRVDASGGLEPLAGALETHLTLDVSRPRAGRALTVTSAPFGGIVPSVGRCQWTRGDIFGVFEDEPISQQPTWVPSEADYEHWVHVQAATTDGQWLSERFFFSRLPVCYLTTDDGKTPSASKEEHAGRVRMQGNDEWKSPYDGRMTINVRGNYSKGRPKKPWKIKLDEKSKLFGMPSSKHWVLLANYPDATGMRNKLVFDFANRIGSLGMRSTWVDCVLNGEWQGLYLLCEHIRVGKNRIDVFDWEEAGEDAAKAIVKGSPALTAADQDALEKSLKENLGWVSTGTVAYKGTTYALGDFVSDFASITNDITGGCLYEFDTYYDEKSKFSHTSGSLTLQTMVNRPEYLYTNVRMFDFNQTFIGNYVKAITSVDGYSAEGRHYSDYADVESMVAYFLVAEMCGNWDAAYRSRYGYKERSGLLKFGPLWDYDADVGGDFRPAGDRDPETWTANFGPYSFLREWADDPWFCTLLWTRYPAARAEFSALIEGGAEGDGLIGEAYRLLREAGLANDRKWSTQSDRVGKETFEPAVQTLRRYLKRRRTWLDRQFQNVPGLMTSLRQGTRGTPSSAPYEKATYALAMTFVNAPENRLWKGRALALEVQAYAAATVAVRVFVNGRELGASWPVARGRAAGEVPPEALTANLGEPNCISLISTDAAGKVLARNYALVWCQKPEKASVILLR